MSKRFLVVDDEPDVLVLVQANVRAWGHDVLATASLDEARRLCRDERPDALILDVSMPEMDGPSFLRLLREEGIEPEHIFLLSAIPPEQLEDLAEDLSVSFVCKPFTAPSLREQLSAVIDQ